MPLRHPRSYLFVPGSRPERFQKASTSGADEIIIDLEDAVGPDEKIEARQHVLAWLNSGNSAYVRINSPETQWFDQDVCSIASNSAIKGIVLPKAESVTQIAHVAAVLRESASILPILETAKGFANLPGVSAAPSVSRLIFGSLDLQADLRIGGDTKELDYFRSALVLHSRACSLLPPVDGVTTNLTVASVTQEEAMRGKRFGFGAKLCIHPKQVAQVHEAYSYTTAEKEWALRVLGAIQESNGAAVALDGKMIDAPVVLRAKEIAEAF